MEMTVRRRVFPTDRTFHRPGPEVFFSFVNYENRGINVTTLFLTYWGGVSNFNTLKVIVEVEDI